MSRRAVAHRVTKNTHHKRTGRKQQRDIIHAYEHMVGEEHGLGYRTEKQSKNKIGKYTTVNNRRRRTRHTK